MKSSQSFPKDIDNDNHVYASGSSEPIATRRTRKELFADVTFSGVPNDSERCFSPHTRTMEIQENTGSCSLIIPDAMESSHVDPMDLWKVYTKRSIDDRDGRAPLTCTWPLGPNAEADIECGYGATPKLMRRHVQTTHMHIKRYRCDICDQAFSQGALLHSHKASKHAQIRPYKCPFEGCDKAYVDSPTLLRHKKLIHNYVPKPITRYR